MRCFLSQWCIHPRKLIIHDIRLQRNSLISTPIRNAVILSANSSQMLLQSTVSTVSVVFCPYYYYYARSSQLMIKHQIENNKKAWKLDKLSKNAHGGCSKWAFGKVSIFIDASDASLICLVSVILVQHSPCFLLLSSVTSSIAFSSVSLLPSSLLVVLLALFSQNSMCQMS